MANQLGHSACDRGADFGRGGWARYNAEEIFCEMVLGEIQGGRVSRSHHARLLTFARQLGITHAAAAALITDCCIQAAAGADPQTRRHAARLASPPEHKTLRACLTIAVIVAAELALIVLL